MPVPASFVRGEERPARVWRAGASRISRLPLLAVAVLAFTGGGALDLLYHLLPGPAAGALEPLLGAEAARAHLLTLVGMGGIFAAVIGRGMRRGR